MKGSIEILTCFVVFGFLVILWELAKFNGEIERLRADVDKLKRAAKVEV
jgi:hypothetical protein